MSTAHEDADALARAVRDMTVSVGDLLALFKRPHVGRQEAKAALAAAAAGFQLSLAAETITRRVLLLDALFDAIADEPGPAGPDAPGPADAAGSAQGG